MFIRDIKDCLEFTAGDDSILRELFNPLKDNLALNYSLAYAKVPPGVTTLRHRLSGSEVYFLLKGKGIMHIAGEQAEVSARQVIYIPPGAWQQISNNGPDDLEFICLVEPAWQAAAEEISS